MSIPQEYIYSGVQALPEGTKTNKVFGVHTQERVTETTEIVEAKLCIQGELMHKTNVMLANTKSVRWSGSRRHILGLHEFFFDIPEEFACAMDLKFGDYLQLISAVIPDDYRLKDRTVQYFLRKAVPSAEFDTRKKFQAVLLLVSFEVSDSDYWNVFPEIQNSLWEIELP